MNATYKQAQTPNRIFTTAHNYDCVCFAIIFNIDIYTSKQSKRAIRDITKSNGKIFNVISAVVIDMHKRTQTEKTLFLSNTATKLTLKKIVKQRFFSLCSMMYINNQSTYDVKNFTVSFIDAWYRYFRLFLFINIHIKYNSQISTHYVL